MTVVVDASTGTTEIVETTNVVGVDQIVTQVVINETGATQVTVSAPGLVGPPGPTGATGATGEPGPNSIGGYGFSLSNLTAGDLLAFGGSAWTNTSQPTLTDGGNF